MTIETRKDAWRIGAIAGAIVFVFLWLFGEPTFMAAVFLGLVTAGLLGAVLEWLFISGTQDMAEADWETGVASRIVSPTDSATHGTLDHYRKDHETGAQLNAQLEARAHQAEADAQVHMAPVNEAAMEWRADHRALSDVEDDDDSVSGAGRAPVALAAPRDGEADDLTLIEGIGPKLSARLNDWGVFHYDQIAGWGEDEIAYADENVPRFKGRCTRDKWVSQAQIIVRDGKDAFLERAKTNDY
ncbi:hypothetical protein BFP70_17000 [Thioclava sp. SK-1]|uniref:hypothetical protein n=1 Tax=Thioclava sp. SK-1 TaxID=1889770 RepID=UPI0008257F89|nr:hypothetical protein [Thioclava sp. SK-1]OCX61141.1 hypothetical protein BFP70_17000 [Thioclava sp. SK-1]